MFKMYEGLMLWAKFLLICFILFFPIGYIIGKKVVAKIDDIMKDNDI